MGMPTSTAPRKGLPSRRRFLASCSALTLAAAGAPSAILAAPFPRGEVPLELIRFEHFYGQLGTGFRVGQNEPVLLVLAAAQLQAPGPPWAPDARNEKFSLLFQGPRALPLEQDTYLFEHPRLGRFPMFIVPVFLANVAGAFYEAIFNRPPARFGVRRL